MHPGSCPCAVPRFNFRTSYFVCFSCRYDHTRLPASGGAAAPVPPPLTSGALHSPRQPPEHNAPVIKSKLRETGKREKKTLVLRDRSE